MGSFPAIPDGIMGPYIRSASHARAFELSLVQFLHGRLEIVAGLEFNKPCVHVNKGY